MTLLATVRRVFRTIREKNVPFKAASIAYYATASFVPLVVLTLAVLSTFGAGDLLVAVLHSTLSRSGSEVLESVLENTRGREIAGAIGVALTGWSGSRVFRGLTLAFEEVYEDGAERSLFDRVEKSFVVVAVLLLAFAFLAATALAFDLDQSAVESSLLVRSLLVVGSLVLVFFPFYYVLPPISATVRHAVPGTAFAALGLVALQVAFHYYVETSGGYSGYGFLGTLLLFITFLHFGANVILVGAVLNATLDW
ncbi:YihY/virulence factor BrkB family protein [Halomicroarcula limicola]|uniref:YihY/virulence factor BrkB family protein n=1 Tax=Haloarcula limicola TaxID=1429915 RepID=A0A8J8C4E0_9EURY|nr:YihY/virulence factor BrkB family protein [Halomicroarcula limicola]MBV0925451.1 YihY/virulence factor BrkB family protein [Halomicroarcula limicola]